jgi:hypothetical protein
MTFYLRDQYNYSMIDIDGSNNDFHVCVDIKSFSVKLLSLESVKQQDFIEDMHAISELRGEWFESVKPFTSEYIVRDFIKSRLTFIGNKWDLAYIEEQ